MHTQESEREYRSVGRFTAAQVRELTKGPCDAIAIGCPVELFERVLEKRAAFRAGKPAAAPKVAPTVSKAEAIEIGRQVVAKHGRAATPPAPKVITDADRRRRADEIGKMIADEKYEEWSNTQYAQ